MYISEPIKDTKLVLSTILLSFTGGSGWDQLLYELQASYFWPTPKFDLLCIGA